AACDRGDCLGDRRARAQDGYRGAHAGGDLKRQTFSAGNRNLSQKIEDYGLIGDCETAALVGRDGSIDWLCWPAFDSDPCFAALLGTNRNGRWLIAPVDEITNSSRRYWDNTLILETRFETADGEVALIDFMPPRGNASDVVRLVRGVRGRVKLRMQLVIRFGFGTDIPWVKKNPDGSGLLAICGQDMTVLRTPVETRGEDLTTVADFEVGEGETVPFVLTYGPSHLPVPEPINPAAALQDTAEASAWHNWLLRAVAGAPQLMQIMYGIMGQRRLLEWEAGWLPGYEGALPVRVGNAAHAQLQLDVYGELIDAFHQSRMAKLEL